MEITDFLDASANSGKLKVILLMFEWVWPKTGMAIYLVIKTLKSVLKNFCSKNWGNRPKIGFCEFKEKFGH